MNVTATARFTPRGDSGRFIDAVIVPGARRACADVGQIILAEAQAIVPVDTGELRESGKTEVRDGEKTVIADVAFTAPHAAYVEYGTGRRGASSAGAGPYPKTSWPGMPAQPYLRPALDKVRPELVGEFAARDEVLTMDILAKMRTLAIADTTLAPIFGTRWFDRQLQPGYIQSGSCVRAKRVSTLRGYSQQGLQNLSRPLIQIDVLDLDPVACITARDAVIDWLGRVEFADSSLFSSPVTTPKQYPNFVENQRAGSEYQTNVLIPVETIDVRVYNLES